MKLPSDWTEEDLIAFVGDIERAETTIVLQLRNNTKAVDVPRLAIVAGWEATDRVTLLNAEQVDRVELVFCGTHRTAYYEPGNIVFWSRVA